MKIAVFKETRPNETRVALTPQVAQQYIKQGHEVLIETDAGLTSFFSNQAYADAGATVTEKANLVSADIFLKVNTVCLLVFKREAESQFGEETYSVLIYLCVVK